MKRQGWAVAWLVVAVWALSACGANTADNHDTHAAVDHSNMFAGVEGEAFDLQFIDGMIVHHEGAIAMSQEAIAQVEQDDLRGFAQTILTAQQAEVTQMRAWRAAWFADAAQTPVDHMEMGAMEVYLAPGKSYDQRFLESMISHHEAAVAMAQAAQARASHDELRAFAEGVISVQTEEIDTMHTWLHEWFGVKD